MAVRCRARGCVRERGEVGGRIDVGVRAVHRHLDDELRMAREDRAEATVAGDLVEEAERRAADQHRIGVCAGGIARDGDGVPGIGGQQRSDDRGIDARLIAQGDKQRLRLGVRASAAAAPRASELERPRPGSGFTTRDVDGGHVTAVLRRRGVAAQHDDEVVDARCADPVDDVLEQRPAVERGKDLRGAEPGGPTSGEDDADDATHRSGLSPRSPAWARRPGGPSTQARAWARLTRRTAPRRPRP